MNDIINLNNGEQIKLLKNVLELNGVSFLSVYEGENQELYIFSCLDPDEYEYLLFEIERRTLIRMLRSEITMYESFSNPKNSIYKIVGFDENFSRFNLKHSTPKNKMSSVNLPIKGKYFRVAAPTQESIDKFISDLEAVGQRSQTDLKTYKLNIGNDDNKVFKIYGKKRISIMEEIVYYSFVRSDSGSQKISSKNLTRIIEYMKDFISQYSSQNGQYSTEQRPKSFDIQI